MEDLSARLGELLSNSDNVAELRSLISALGLGKSAAGSPPDAPPPSPPPPPPENGAGGSPGIDIGALLGMLGGKSGGSSPPPGKEQPTGGIDPGMIGRILGVLGAMNNSDRNTELLRALEPFCDDHRKKRVEEAAQIMRILKLLPLITGDTKEA